MATISLYDLTQCALVVPAATGVSYSNQAHGTACAQPMVEGFIVPIAHDHALSEPNQALEHRITSIFPEGGPGTLGNKEADLIDAILHSRSNTAGISVNRAMLDESMESWLHVTVQTIELVKPMSTSFSAILTWPNSD